MNGCKHIFCFDCIKKWSEYTNKCPLCKTRFTELHKININNKKIKYMKKILSKSKIKI